VCGRFSLTVSEEIIQQYFSFEFPKKVLPRYNIAPSQEVLVVILVPRPLRDRFYDFIAENRYKWFGKRESCMIPTPDIRKRFLE
jgi:predicted DCC family thiol-disulfide oxidoreductase YuxK